MTKRQVSAILAAHLILCWVAVGLRIDRFPLTWAPMYSVYRPPKGPEFRVNHREKTWLKENGWLATHRDGSTRWITQRDVNLPTRNMWRLYYYSTFGGGPPKYKHINFDAGTFDRWLFGLEPGENYYEINWQRRLLTSLNKTFDRKPEDSDFIVSVEAKGEFYLFDRKTLALNGTRPRHAVATWEEPWREDF